jgi:predicted nucleic acid-binding Zn ribbon protein
LNKEFVAAPAILKKVLKRYGLSNRVDEYAFVAKWHEIVGVEVAKRAKPERVSNGILFIRVTDSIWAQELSLRSEKIISRVNQFLTSPKTIHSLRFFVA